MTNKYNEQFEANLATLNTAQRAAVEQIEGPVMVIAGPGTGKTHILASRIGYIRMLTDAHASNILCLTFTEAGASAMRKRLLELIGPEAHKVHIFTFHGFCNHIIRNHSELFGSRDMDLLTDLERIETVRALIDALPSDSPLTNFGDAYFYEPHLSNLFKTIKTEDWSIAEINRAIDEYNQSLPQRADYQYKIKNRGELKEENIRKEIEKMERLRAAAALYPAYQDALKQKKRYDFDDMILWVIEAFSNNENLLRNYQEQYLYFLIDEYQDTNGAQNKVLQQLITYWELPNVFIVGDDDQAIYEFQGARLKSLKDLYAKFENDINVVVLKENYRSTQAILDDLKELGLDKQLLASNPQLKKSATQPQIIEYPTTIHEYGDIAIQIQTLIEQGELPDTIAIIYAKNKQALTMMQLMDKKGIPYTTKRPINILQERIVQQILTLLRYLQAESTESYSGEPFLFQILHYHCWQIPSREIAQLALYLRQKNQLAEQPIFWRQAIAKYFRPSVLAEANLTELDAFFRASDILEKLCDDVNRVSVAQLYERILNQTGILRHAIDAPDAINEVQTLHTMFGFVQKEMEKRNDFSLQDLITTLSMMETHRLSLPMQKTISAGKGVLLTTAHSSKGLEFKYVFMIDCAEDTWGKSDKGNRMSFKLPDTLTLTQGGEENSDEARRLL
jgi:DNA helicase II / ATP-dependent DNA helicase PcrA